MIPINVEPVNFNVSQSLVSHVKEMFGGIDKYNDMAVNADVYLKSLKETPTKEKEVSIKINMPAGKDIFVTKSADDFTSAAQQLYDTLKVTLNRHKDQHKQNHRPVSQKF